MAWQVPLWAVPFALFFGTINGPSRNGYLGAYVGSLIFALSINLCIWFTQWVVLPHLPTIEGRMRVWQHGLVFGGAAMVGAFLAAFTLQRTIAPGFMSNAQAVLVMGMYTVLFVVMITALVYATRFYRDSIERAKSDQELELARRIQSSFLPSEFPSLPRLEIHAVNVPSKQVSGDFYDVVVTDDQGYLIAIADVAGKGVPAALLSSMLQASLRTQANGSIKVGTVLRTINTLVYRSTAVNQFATFFLARIDAASLRLTFSNAGHNFPVVFRAGGGRETLERGGTVVGILENATFDEAAVDLQPGDRVVLYTDGISEAMNAAGEMFGEDRIYGEIERLPRDLTARDITTRLLAAVHTFLDGVEPGDDMTVMVLRIT